MNRGLDHVAGTTRDQRHVGNKTPENSYPHGSSILAGENE